MLKYRIEKGWIGYSGVCEPLCDLHSVEVFLV